MSSESSAAFQAPTGAPAPRGEAPAPSASNLHAAVALLEALRRRGLRHAVLCPGSRSAPLALAAALLEPDGLLLYTAIDERSAAFFALALGRASGVAAAVITTSGSAVAQLLPAAVEADHAAIPLLLLSADRPARLKGCGANQSVNQETFLRDSCRWYGQGAAAGMAQMCAAQLEALAEKAWAHSLGCQGSAAAGAVHLNLPFEEPLHADAGTMAALVPLLRHRPSRPPREPQGQPTPVPGPPPAAHSLDPSLPGVVVAGPWRGSPASWPAHLAALIRWQRRSGWPVLADPLSGLRGCSALAVVGGYDLVLEQAPESLGAPQVLRLGPLPASRRLERWLAALGGRQLLVSEVDPRPLDPLAVVMAQECCGLAAWVAAQEARSGAPQPGEAALALQARWHLAERRVQQLLEARLPAAPGRTSHWSEPLLSRQLSRLLPAGLPLMLANSSPVRDWESFADPRGPARPIFGFRGASGIDGTLSEACGIAEALGGCCLLSGDLALLHDSNGWLWRSQLRGRLTVVLVDNGGGGIFEQLPIRLAGQPGEASLLDFERLFAMPQAVDPLALAAAHGVPGRRVPHPEALPEALAWALAQPISLLLLSTDRRRDAELRRRLRTMAAEDCCSG